MKRIPWNKGLGIKKYCIGCNFQLKPSTISTGGIRCRKCYYIYRYTNFKPHINSLKALKPKSKEWLQEHKIHLNHLHTKKTKKIISEKKKGKLLNEENPLWMGDKVGYSALHGWIARKLGKPRECEFCKTKISSRYHWANRSGKYTREFNDWIRLCPSCHHSYDNISKKLWETRRKIHI